MEAKQVKDLMEAYASVYSQQFEQEVISESECEEEEKSEEKETPKMNGKKKVKKKKKEKEEEMEMKEGVDLFDYLLEYLVAEGYADTNKAALAIMANMSEEWKQSIVEADSVAAMRERAAKRRQQRYGKSGGGGRDDYRPYTEDDYKKPGSGAASQAKDA